MERRPRSFLEAASDGGRTEAGELDPAPPWRIAGLGVARTDKPTARPTRVKRGRDTFQARNESARPRLTGAMVERPAVACEGGAWMRSTRTSAAGPWPWPIRGGGRALRTAS